MSALATVDGNSIQCRPRANVGRNTPADGEFAKAGGSLQEAAEDLPNDLVGGLGVDGYSFHQPAADERDPPGAADPPDYR